VVARFRLPKVRLGTGELAKQPGIVIIDGQIQPTMVERQAALAEADALGQGIDVTNSIRFDPLNYNPASQTRCVGTTAAGIPDSDLIAHKLGGMNLDFSCPRVIKNNIQNQVGDFFSEQGEDIQNQLDGAEAEINRVDENLENIRDEAREGVGSVFGGGARIIKFIGFAIVAIVVVLIIRLVVGIFR